MEETEEQKAAREAEEAAAAAEAKAEEEEKAAREAALADMTPEERAAKEAAEAAAAAAGEKKGPAGEEVTVQIGNEQPPADDKAPGWVRDVRKRNRELEKENRALKVAQRGEQLPTVGTKPTMSDAEIDYDADKFEAALNAWNDRKRRSDEEAERIEKQHKVEQDAWQVKLDAYGQGKTQIKVTDYEDAEALVRETLNERQTAIIVKGAKNPALLIYALGKNPAKAKELSAITDLVEFAFAVANVETQLKITTKKATPPAPEKKITGDAPSSGAVDNVLDRLRAEAERTGDYSKVHAHKKKKAA